MSSPASFPYSIALVCASNQNRSVEAHYTLLTKGYRNLYSFGTSRECKLPGPSIDKPNVYAFGTPYRKIYEDLKAQNPELYKANGLLQMLERNSKVKVAPERWQEEKKHFDIVITFEDRVFDTVVEDIGSREPELAAGIVHIFNISTKDNHEGILFIHLTTADAAIGALHALQLVQMLQEKANDWQSHIDSILDNFQRHIGKDILHHAVFY